MSDPEVPLIRPSGYVSRFRLREEAFDRMRDLIERLQWSDYGYGGHRRCVVCRVKEPGPHGMSCDIGQVLAQTK